MTLSPFHQIKNIKRYQKQRNEKRVGKEIYLDKALSSQMLEEIVDILISKSKPNE